MDVIEANRFNGANLQVCKRDQPYLESLECSICMCWKGTRTPTDSASIATSYEEMAQTKTIMLVPCSHTFCQ
eukprot:3938643-Rhodomonas_salina.1